MEDKYTSMSAPELAGEDSFIKWVIKGDQDANWQEWQSANPARQKTIEEARQIVKALSTTSADNLDLSSRHELWKRISASTNSAQYSRDKFYKWAFAAAASLALVIWINSTPVRVIAHNGQHKEVSLPETSEVIVNADSKISYQKNFFRKREVRLDGEAYFKVNPGSTFTVITDEGNVTVLGTSFNVVARNGEFEVKCYTGKVLVTNKQKEEVTINPGEKVENIQSKLSRSTFTDPDQPDWIAGKFTFDNEPLTNVIAELSRQYDINVQLESGLEEMRYTGLFENGDLEEALDMITWPLQLTSEIKGETVVIRR